MDKDRDKKRLKQEDNLNSLLCKKQINEMVTIYLSNGTEQYDHSIYCALIPQNSISKCLEDFSWDLGYEEGLPGSCKSYDNGVETVRYDRYGFNDGIEPLIYDRDFHGIKDRYREINEEFRLFHNLYHDTKENKFIKIDSSGREETIAIISDNKIQIRLKEIREFLAIKEMVLSIQFDFREYSMFELSDLSISEDDKQKTKNEDSIWALGYGDGLFCSFISFSRMCGKYIIQPLPKSKSGLWRFAEEKPKQFVEYIIGSNEDGENINYTSDPDSLTNYFGSNPDAPHYLTPVHFAKAVLDKYYTSSKFSIDDGYLSCGALWGLQIDNHHPDTVCVWLGDLGRDLPYEEQLYWKSYNIPPAGTVSDVYFKRQILAEFTDSKQPEHLFNIFYDNLIKESTKNLSWPILLPLAKEDEYHIKRIRIPATENQSEFDDLILSLTKILIDSLNEKELNKLIPEDKRSDLKGSINKLDCVLQQNTKNDFSNHITFLKNLQNLRSSGVAHLKGKNYNKIASEFGVHTNSLISIFKQILEEANKLLEFLTKEINNGVFASKNNQ